MGGLRARAAQNRRFTTTVNLRVAVLAGVCIYLGMAAVGDLDSFVTGEPDRAAPVVGPSGWPVLLAGLLTAVVVAVPWLARRGFVIGASLAAAAAASYGFSHGQTTSYLVTQLVCLAAVAALTGGTGYRPPAWLWLIGVVVAAFVLAGYLPLITHRWQYIAPAVDLCVIVVAVAWVVIDARPLAAVATYFVLWQVPPIINNLAAGIGIWFDSPALLVAASIAALAVWRLRRQSLRPGQAAQ